MYTTGTAVASLNPSVTGTVSSYSVSPPLPAGLSLNTTSGQITGTPTVTTTQTIYTITASNAAGSATFALTLTVSPPFPAPSALSYPSPQSFDVGVAITPLDPTVTGTIASYSVTPALPTGLLLNVTTGQITGTPATVTAPSTYTVSATNAAGSVTFALSIATLLPRVFMDRPDEQTGPQIHVMYVLPSDGADQQLDRTGQLQGSVASLNEWMITQTGGKRMRVDTYDGGKLDVTFLRTPQDAATLRAAGAALRDKLEYLLLGNGFDKVDKVYVVYYGGSNDTNCANAAWPPTLPGIVGGIYLLTTVPGAAPCNSTGFATAAEAPRYTEFVALHEVLHVLGFVAQCAPNHTLAGHTSDGPEDLMYAGNQPWRPAVLDTNRDDYYGTGSSVCPDLADSAFLDPSPTNPVLPSGWPYINAHEATIPCASEATVVPGAPGAFSRMTVVHNYFSGTVPCP
jgi:hypothetical protein